MIVLWHCFAAEHPLWAPALTSCILVMLEFVSIVIDMILMTELRFKHPEASKLSPWHRWMWAWLTRAVIDKIDAYSFMGIGLSMETYLVVLLGSHDKATDYDGIMFWSLRNIVPSLQIVWNARSSGIIMRKILSYTQQVHCMFFDNAAQHQKYEILLQHGEWDTSIMHNIIWEEFFWITPKLWTTCTSGQNIILYTVLTRFAVV